MAKLTNIIIHCSDSEFGSASEIRRWHLAQGWKDIGYHFVILNGLILPQTNYQKQLFIPALDGTIEVGRKVDGDDYVTDNEAGAHALGYNGKSIGICLIGIKKFSHAQVTALVRLLESLMKIYRIPGSGVLGHYQVCPNKTCPNFNVTEFKQIHNLAQWQY